MNTATRIPRWTIWSVVLGLAMTVAVSVGVDAVTADAPLDRDDLGRYVLRSTDPVDELAPVGAYESVELALDPRSGADAAHIRVFSDLENTPGSVQEAVRDWSRGHRVVISEALSFDSVAAAEDFLGSVWSDYTLGALERQQGPDGSLLMFHPDFERGGGALVGPVAIAAWAIDSDVLMITYVGADDATDALHLARIVEGRHSGGGA